MTRHGWLGAVLAIVALVAGCGDDDDSDAGSAARSGDLAEMRQTLETYRAVPEFTAPGPAFDAREAAQGKTLLSIPASSAIPFVRTI